MRLQIILLAFFLFGEIFCQLDAFITRPLVNLANSRARIRSQILRNRARTYVLTHGGRRAREISDDGQNEFITNDPTQQQFFEGTDTEVRNQNDVPNFAQPNLAERSTKTEKQQQESLNTYWGLHDFNAYPQESPQFVAQNAPTFDPITNVENNNFKPVTEELRQPEPVPEPHRHHHKGFHTHSHFHQISHGHGASLSPVVPQSGFTHGSASLGPVVPQSSFTHASFISHGTQQQGFVPPVHGSFGTQFGNQASQFGGGFGANTHQVVPTFAGPGIHSQKLIQNTNNNFQIANVNGGGSSVSQNQGVHASSGINNFQAAQVHPFSGTSNFQAAEVNGHNSHVHQSQTQLGVVTPEHNFDPRENLEEPHDFLGNPNFQKDDCPHLDDSHEHLLEEPNLKDSQVFIHNLDTPSLSVEQHSEKVSDPVLSTAFSSELKDLIDQQPKDPNPGQYIFTKSPDELTPEEKKFINILKVLDERSYLTYRPNPSLLPYNAYGTQANMDPHLLGDPQQLTLTDENVQGVERQSPIVQRDAQHYQYYQTRQPAYQPGWYWARRAQQSSQKKDEETVGSIFVFPHQRRQNDNWNVRRRRRKRHVPITRLIKDPKVKIDMEKTVDNIGTVTRKAFEDQRAPMFHLRNMLGSVKNMLMSAMRVAPQNFIVPSQYEIIKNIQEPSPKPTKSHLLGAINPSVYSRTDLSNPPINNKGRTFKPLIEPKTKAAQRPNGDPFGIMDTFKKVGTSLRDSVKSGQDTLVHMGDLFNDARNVIHTTRHGVPRVIRLGHQYYRAPVAMSSRFGGEEEQAPPPQQVTKTMIIAPRLLDVQESRLGASNVKHSPQFVNLGSMLDALGVSKPKGNLGLNKITITQPGGEPKSRTARLIPPSIDVQDFGRLDAFKEESLLQDQVGDTLDNLENAKISVGAKTLRDFLVRMKNEFKELTLGKQPPSQDLVMSKLTQQARQHDQLHSSLNQVLKSEYADYRAHKSRLKAQAATSINKIKNIAIKTKMDQEKLLGDIAQSILKPKKLEVPSLLGSQLKPFDQANKVKLGLVQVDVNTNDPAPRKSKRQTNEDILGASLLFTNPELYKPFMGRATVKEIDSFVHRYVPQNNVPQNETTPRESNTTTPVDVKIPITEQRIGLEEPHNFEEAILGSPQEYKEPDYMVPWQETPNEFIPYQEYNLNQHEEQNLNYENEDYSPKSRTFMTVNQQLQKPFMGGVRPETVDDFLYNYNGNGDNYHGDGERGQGSENYNGDEDIYHGEGEREQSPENFDYIYREPNNFYGY